MLVAKYSHNRSSFFRYMTTKTADLVLSGQSFRWSSPLLFNDPFDVPRELAHGLTPQALVAAVARRHASLIEQPPEDTSHLSPGLREIIETIKKGIPDSLKAELVRSLREEAKALTTSDASLEAFRAMGREAIRDLRILCLTDSASNVAMWYHYAGCYTGVVLELACDANLDSAWLAAKPVTYPEKIPEIYTLDGWAEFISLKHELAVKRMVDISTFTKTPHWSYEREWRAVTFKRPTDRGYFSDYRFDPSELATVFFGPMMSPQDKACIQGAVNNKYPYTKTVDVSFGLSRELLFNGLNN